MSSNLDGQVMGRKGRETRSRLLEEAVQLLATTPLREVRAADLARKAGISPASFYLYFENIEAVALALADELAEQAKPLIEILGADWTWSDENGQILTFVRAYFDFWDVHRPVLRVQNLAAEEGDWSFQTARQRTTIPLHHGLAAKIDKSMQEGRIDQSQHSLTLASVALAGIERSASNYKTFPQKFGVTRERLIESSVLMLKSIILGQYGTPPT